MTASRDAAAAVAAAALVSCTELHRDAHLRRMSILLT